MFLSKDLCESEGQSNVPVWDYEDSDSDGECKLDIISTFIPVQNDFDFMTYVYAYLVRSELRKRVKSHCFGCRFDKNSQMDHMDGGCTDSESNQIYKHSMPCHRRISAALLLYACEMMASYYENEHVITYESAANFIKHVKPEDNLFLQFEFYYEFKVLDDL